MKSKNYGVKPGSNTPARSSNAPLRFFEQPTDESKQFATLRALLAIKGHELHRTDCDDGEVRFYVTRWNLVRELQSLAAVRAFAEQVGALNG